MKEEHSTICSVESPTGNEVEIVRRSFVGTDGPRVALVAGLRGDAPEGIRALHEVTLTLRRVGALRGRVDIYPCANPLAAHQGSRRWPFFDVDLNRLFPGRLDGHPPDRLAYQLVESIGEMNIVVEIKGAKPAFREVAQAHVRAGFPDEALVAQQLGVDLIWQRNPGPSSSAAFYAQFGCAVTVGGGVGGRLAPGVASRLERGLMNMFRELGMIDGGEEPALPVPRIVTDPEVHRMRAEQGGLFLPEVDLDQEVDGGEVIGRVVDPTVAEDLEVIFAPVAGRVMAIRDQPVVVPGSMLARIVASQESVHAG